MLALLLTLGITGFLAPGFFLNSDDTAAGPPRQVAQAIVDGINANNQDSLNALKCGDAEQGVIDGIANAPSVSNVQLGRVEKVSEAEYQASFSVPVNGPPNFATGTISKAGEGWCWKKFTGLRSTIVETKAPRATRSATPRATAPTAVPPPTQGSEPPANSEGAVLVKNFLDKINAKDKVGATALLCKENVIEVIHEYIEKAVSKPSTSLTAKLAPYSSTIYADLGGTYDGRAAEGIIMGRSSSPACISGFIVY